MTDPKRQRGGPVLLEHALRDFLAESKLGPKLATTRVIRAWQKALGPALSKHAQAVRFENGDLWTEVDSSAHLHDLVNFSGERYRRAANQTLGQDTIRRVIFQNKR